MSWILNIAFGKLWEAAVNMAASEFMEAWERSERFKEADKKGKDLADRVKDAKTEEEKRNAARDLADNSF